jgi:lysophospholipase L1-like esterase
MAAGKRRKAKLGPAQAKLMRAALAEGRKRGDAIVKERAAKARRAARRAARRGPMLAGAAPAAQGGVLVAEGDSWFDYPFYDVLEKLEDDFGFRVESVAHKGDTVEQMAYDDAQFKQLQRAFQHLSDDGKVPRAILLSGGGNDIAGTEFGMFLNHVKSGLPAINDKVAEGVMDERLRFATGYLIATVTRLSEQFFNKKIPVLIHGYAYPVPDGRGYLGGFWFLPGPWLKPGFVEKGFFENDSATELATCTGLMKDMIDRFNAVQSSIAGATGYEHVTFVDLRPLLSNALPTGYKKSWGNELHPTEDGFEAVAGEFGRVLGGLPIA